MESQRLDELYQTPPDRFVAARDALVAELRAAGKKEEAKAAAALRRPAPAAWLVNRLARTRAAEVEALLECSERLRRAQTSREGDVREAMRDQREAVRKLGEHAARAAAEAGVKGDHARQVQINLLAAAAGPPELRERLRRGTLEGDLEAAGFEALGKAVLPAPEKPASRERPVVQAKRATEQVETPSESNTSQTAARARTAAAEARKAKAQEQARAAEEAKRRAATVREAKRLVAAASSAEKHAATLEARAFAAEQQAAAARAAAGAARRAAAEAAQAAEQAQKDIIESR